MFTPITSFSGFSVNNLDQAKEFYTQTLGLELKNDSMGLELALPGGGTVFIYQKDDHTPASYTTLNFVVENVDAAIDTLVRRDVQFEHYNYDGMKQDEKGVLRGRAANMGPDIAWFKDPAGNTLSILQN